MTTSSKLLSHRGALCNMVRRIAIEAGELILEYFDGIRDIDTMVKPDGSSVTKADQDAEKLIKSRLRDIFPDIPMIGEEGFAAGDRVDLQSLEYFWLVDPLDGTRSFIKGGKDFTVNIALIYEGEPVLGVVYAPELGELYAGYIEESGGSRAFRFFEDSEKEKDIRTRAMPREGLTVFSSTYHAVLDKQEAFLERFKVAKAIRRSSSIKICQIASGKADLYPRFGETCIWDTAAGHAILRAAGGDIRDIQGNSLRYNSVHPDLLNPEFIAASDDVWMCLSEQ